MGSSLGLVEASRYGDNCTANIEESSVESLEKKLS